MRCKVDWASRKLIALGQVLRPRNQRQGYLDSQRQSNAGCDLGQVSAPALQVCEDLERSCRLAATKPVWCSDLPCL